jgi:hypothetical protein
MKAQQTESQQWAAMLERWLTPTPFELGVNAMVRAAYDAYMAAVESLAAYKIYSCDSGEYYLDGYDASDANMRMIQAYENAWHEIAAIAYAVKYGPYKVWYRSSNQ